jgi:hypothetical protein
VVSDVETLRSLVAVVGFSARGSTLGNGSSFRGRGLSAIGAGAATGSGCVVTAGGAVTDVGHIHHARTPASRTAFTASAASKRPDAGLHGALGRGAGDRRR